jgi:hypothetical protein
MWIVYAVVSIAAFWLAMYVVAQAFGVLAGLGDWARGRGRPERWVAPPWSDDAWRDLSRSSALQDADGGSPRFPRTSDRKWGGSYRVVG